MTPEEEAAAARRAAVHEHLHKQALELISEAHKFGAHIYIECVPGPGSPAMGNHVPHIRIWDRKK